MWTDRRAVLIKGALLENLPKLTTEAWYDVVELEPIVRARERHGRCRSSIHANGFLVAIDD